MAVVGNVRTVTRDFEHWVRTVDPTREQEMRKTLEYEFGSGAHRRLFYADPNKRGAYGGPRPPLITVPDLDIALDWLPSPLSMSWFGELDVVWDEVEGISIIPPAGEEVTMGWETGNPMLWAAADPAATEVIWDTD